MMQFGNVDTISLDNPEYFEILGGLWAGKKPPFTKAGVIRNTNFTASGDVDFSDVAWLDVETKQLAKRQLKYGDIVIERSGGGPKQPVGRVVQFRRDDGVFSFSNFTTTVRVKKSNELEPLFAFYVLLELYQSGRTDDIQRRTTGLRNLDFKAYKERANFPLISTSEQRRIAHVLTTVQTAIEQQARLIALTRELKSALMKKLFTEGLHGEPQKETEIGLVPASWNVGKFIEFCILQRGFDITKKEQTAGYVPVVSSGGISSYHNVAKVKAPGVVIGRKGSLGTVHYIDVDYWPHDTTLWVKDFKGNNPLFTAYFIETLQLKKYNSGVSNPTLNRNTVHADTVCWPQVDEQKEIGQILNQCDSKIRIIEQKKNLLEELFRTLLHQLMTGQIRLNEANVTGF